LEENVYEQISLLEERLNTSIQLKKENVFQLAVLYDQVEEYDKALGLYLGKQLREFPPAIYRVGVMNKYGIGLSANEFVFEECLLKAARLGHFKSEIELAKHYIVRGSVKKKVIGVIGFTKMIFSIRRILKTAKNFDQAY